jgi:hypothetical protein
MTCDKPATHIVAKGWWRGTWHIQEFDAFFVAQFCRRHACEVRDERNRPVIRKKTL